MIALWTTAGTLVGWVVMELLSVAITKKTWPYPFNIAMAFVGGLTAYTIADYLIG